MTPSTPPRYASSLPRNDTLWSMSDEMGHELQAQAVVIEDTVTWAQDTGSGRRPQLGHSVRLCDAAELPQRRRENSTQRTTRHTIDELVVDVLDQPQGALRLRLRQGENGDLWMTDGVCAWSWPEPAFNPLATLLTELQRARVEELVDLAPLADLARGHGWPTATFCPGGHAVAVQISAPGIMLTVIGAGRLRAHVVMDGTAGTGQRARRYATVPPTPAEENGRPAYFARLVKILSGEQPRPEGNALYERILMLPSLLPDADASAGT